MIITFSRPNSQVAFCLHMALPPTNCRTPHPPGLSIGIRNIRDGRGCGLEQAIKDVQRDRLDLVSLKETTWMEACSKNPWDYGDMCAAARPCFYVGAQDGKGLRARDQPNG